MVIWHNTIGLFEYMARVLFVSDYPCFLYILFIVIVMLTNNPRSTDGQGARLKVGGPGFDPRSQHFIFLSPLCSSQALPCQASTIRYNHPAV